MLAHIKHLGEGSELYLPFAKAKLERLAVVSRGRPAHQTYDIGDFRVTVQVYDKNSGAISIDGDSASYTFFSTGPSVQYGSVEGFAFASALKGYAVKVKYDKALDRLVGKPLGSSLESSPDDAWRFLPVAGDMNKVLKGVWQVNAIPEQAYFPKVADPKRREMLLSAWTCANDVPGFCIYSGVYTLKDVNDIFYDIPPRVFSANRSSPKSAVVPDADWYRRGALRVVTHPTYGTRKFVVLTDASNTFIVYPVGAEKDDPVVPDAYIAQGIKTTSSDASVQRAAPTLPAWCRVYAHGAARDDYVSGTTSYGEYVSRHPQSVWKFNAAGTRAVALVEHDFAPAFFPATTFTYLGTPHTHPYAGQSPGGAFSDTAFFAIRESLPGLVEYALNITLTGPEPKDFTFGLSLAQQIDPTASTIYPVAVDYAWDIGHPELQVADDLILLYGEVFHSRTTWATRYSDYCVRFTIKNLTSGAVQRTIRGESMVIRGDRPDSADDMQSKDVAFYSGSIGALRQDIDHDRTHLNIAALDLRIGGLVLERRLTRKKASTGADAHTAATESAAVKIEASCWGQLQEQRFLTGDATLNAALDALNAIDPTGSLTLLDPNKFGSAWGAPVVSSPYLITPGGYAPFYGAIADFNRTYGLYYTNVLATPPYDNAGYHAGLYQMPVGAALYGFMVRPALIAGPYARFVAHPDGHWSVATQRCAFYGGTSRVPFTEWYDFAITGASALAVVGSGNDVGDILDPAAFVQDFVDIVSARVTNPDGSTRDVKTTHLALFNEAYGKSLTKSDFLCDVSLVTTPSAVPGSHYEITQIKLGDKQDATQAVYLFLADTNTTLAPPNRRFTRVRSPHYLELARDMKLLSDVDSDGDLQMMGGISNGPGFSYSTPVVPLSTLLGGGGTVTTTDSLGAGVLTNAAVLNGSALFAGRMTK